MVQKILKELNPSRQPVAYVFLLLIAYQIFFKGEAIPDYWEQYVLEFLVAAGLWGTVTPTEKTKENE